MATDVEQVMKELANVKAFVEQKADEKIAPVRQEVDRLAKAFLNAEELLKRLQHERMAKNDDGTIRLREGPFAGMDLLDLRILSGVLGGWQKGSPDRRSRYLPIVEDARRQLRKGLGLDALMGWQEGNIQRRASMVQNPQALTDFRSAFGQWTRMVVDVYQRALDSSTAGAGDELVPTLEAAELWLDVNLETQILPLLTQMPMPSNPFDIPIQFGDANWYPVTENVQVTTNDPATQKVTLTAYGLKTGVPFSDELEEDAVIALVPELRRNLVRNAAEVIDDVLLNADTAVTNNINSDSTTISKTTAGKAHWLLGFNGIRKLPLADNTAQRLDANTVVLADNYNRIMARLAKYAVPRREGEVVFVSDVRTNIRAMSLAEVITIEKAGGRATMSTGELTRMFGMPYIRSSQMRQADTDGNFTGTSGATTNTFGNVLVLNTSQWRVGFRRQITLEADREPGKGQTVLYVSFRVALTERSGTRSTATHTALMYDITGT